MITTITLVASLLAVGPGSGAAGSHSSDWAVAILPSGAEFILEIADDDAERRLGYMYRDFVGPSEGMLFLFDHVDRHSIWMKNCEVALDIVWLDDAFRVVHLASEQQPCPSGGPCPSILPSAAARYVLELAGGAAQKAGLETGDAIVVLWEGSPR